MQIRLLVRVVVVVALAGRALPAGAASDELRIEQVTAAGLPRTYRLLVPADLPAEAPTPVVLAFHGAGGQGGDMLVCRRAASARRWLLVCPDALAARWSVGSPDPARAAQAASDLALVPAILAQLQQRYRLDLQRVFATGFSAGGGMTIRLAARHPEWFAAVASVAHTLTQSTLAVFPPPRPLSVMYLIGSEDPGLGEHGKAVGQHSVSAAEAARRWAEVDHCGPAVTTEQPGSGPGEPPTIRVTRYADGQEGTTVELYWLLGVGHTWPRATNAPGDPPRFDAAESVFNFFAGQRREQQ